jgi:RNA-directed DNA polymerase
MMHGPEKSDPVILGMKPANNPGRTGAESVDRRTGAKENASETRAGRTLGRETASSSLERVRERARQDQKVKFTALLHHVDVELLRKSFLALKRKAAPGVDGVTWHDYEQDLEIKLVDLHARVHRGAYRAQPSRRRLIPKEDGRQRPLGVTALEDKIVQRAVVELLNAIYEPMFLGFSYGFRRGRSQHNALDALAFGITRMKVSFIVDADVRSFFDSLSQPWLMRFIEHRIGDPRILRLIRKWLKAGVMENGEWMATEEGTPQGSVISPTLANIYLHYCFDLWAHAWRQRRARGQVVLVRYADDSVAGFEHKDDAERFLADLRQRLEKFDLSLHPEKTRLIEFGRFAAERRVKARCKQTGDVQLPRLHSHLWSKSERRVSASADNSTRPISSPSEVHQRGVAATHARTDSRTGTVARQKWCAAILRTTRSPPMTRACSDSKST